MTNTLKRSGYSYTTPAVAYQPARPAYDSYETVLVSGSQNFTPDGGLAPGWVYVLVPTTLEDGTVVQRGVPRWTGNGAGSVTGFGTTYYTTQLVHHPATPEVLGSGATRMDVPPLGWTSFAHSIAAIHGGGLATFKALPGVSGVAIGFSAVPNPTHGYGHIRNGLLLSGGTVRNLRTGASLGSYDAADVLGIQLRSSTLSFTNDGSEIGTDPSLVTPGEPLYLSAVLYGAGDAVDEPTLDEQQFGSSSAVLTPLAAFGGEGDKAVSFASMSPLTAATSMRNTSTALLGGLRAFSGELAGHGGSEATLSPIDADSYGGTVIVLPNSSSYAQLSGMVAASLLLVGETGTSTATLKPLLGLAADRPYGGSFATLKPLNASSYNEDPSMAFMLETVTFDFAMTVAKVETIEVRDVIEVDVEIATTLVETVQVLDDFGFDVAFATTEVDIVDVRDSFLIDVVMTAPGADLEVHAVNLDGFGSTTYAGYPFNSFARIGDRYYGAKLDGLFLLGGDDDAGAPIQAAICPGTLDFGSPQEKTISEAFIGAASEGCMALKIAAGEDGDEYLYVAQSYSEKLKQHRFKLGKGLKANYLTPVFYNQNGEDFEIDSLEFSVATLSRKT
ncbi:hypothetical protein C7T35_01445 [Variovorax sp. WS11]|uniref:hypothetical protein n=1 Tax=Variovorax sp. WS11 TaxID=1105204 RepID=UPI000D0DBCAA|nr:hypothetical protein [Variovorax sp. WS11]NDZ11483.1 hypothetical protein [Variovorax sp. WS11]PSL86659.1 hypothetical protein C7T35_01445 [Variovorax sp. WS11]